MSSDSRQSMQEIFDHVGAGRLADAETRCRAILAETPDAVNALGMLGAILLKNGQYDEAEATLRKTIELAPEFAKPHEDLGVLCLSRGDAQSALRFLENAVALDPDAASAHQVMAAALRQLGRMDDAQAAYRRFISLAPGADPLREADKYRKEGDRERAEQICQDVLNREPNNTGALGMLAVMAIDRERYVVAEGLLRRIVSLEPRNTAALYELGRFLGNQGRFPEGIDILQQAMSLNASDPRIPLALGDLLAIMGRPSDSLAAYERCLELAPNEKAALAGRGHMLRVAGRKEEAIESYRRAVDAQPDAGDGWWNLASIPDYSFNDSNVEEMQALAALETMPKDSKVPLRFALAHALEERGDFDGAWTQYAMANELKRSLVKYDPVDTELTQRKIIETFTPELLGQAQAPTSEGPVPCFIVGMPRSGSTLIEQILASHSMVGGLGELPYIVMLTHSLRNRHDDRIQYPEAVKELDESGLTGLGRSYLHYATAHLTDDQSFFTDKMPANFAHVGFIRMILPNAKIIDARRHPLATCVANYRYLFAQGKNYTYDLAEFAEYYLQYDRVMKHWDEVLPGTVLRVQYEDVVGDLEGEIRRLLDFCGLPFEEDCLDFHQTPRAVNTASAEQVRQPIYESALEYWKNYESHLDFVKDILAPVLPEH